MALSILDDWSARYGQPWIAFHRVDLHNELKLMATDANISNTKPALLRTGVTIVDVVGVLVIYPPKCRNALRAHQLNLCGSF